MGQLDPRKTTNLATLYDQELMPWSRAARPTPRPPRNAGFATGASGRSRHHLP